MSENHNIHTHSLIHPTLPQAQVIIQRTHADHFVAIKTIGNNLPANLAVAKWGYLREFLDLRAGGGAIFKLLTSSIYPRVRGMAVDMGTRSNDAAKTSPVWAANGEILTALSYALSRLCMSMMQMIDHHLGSFQRLQQTQAFIE